MSHCVPAWTENGGVELDAVLPAHDCLQIRKGKWEAVPLKRSHFLGFSFVPDGDDDDDDGDDDDSWTHYDPLTMQGQGNKGGTKPQWQGNFNAPPWPGPGQEHEHGVTPSKPTSAPGKYVPLQPVVNEPVVDAPASASSLVQDDELVSWLQYPLDDSLERNYCSDFFGELPNSMQLLKDSFAGQGAIGRAQRNSGPESVGNAPLNRAASTDAAMALGAGRAAGLIASNGVETFNKVRTMQPFLGKFSPSYIPNSSKGLGACTSSPVPAGSLSSPMLPPKSHTQNSAPFQPSRPGTMNFSHFSRPAVMMKANLHSLGMTGSNTRLKGQLGAKPAVDASTSTGSSIVESTTTRHTEIGARKETPDPVEGSDGPESLGPGSNWPSIRNSLSSQDGEAAHSALDSDSKPMEQENCRNSNGTGSDRLGETGKSLPHGAEALEAPEPTITSSSRGSGNSGERGKEAASSGKRRVREGEESECQSEDGEEEMVDLKKPQQRGSATKRSRAAEVHNLSERRRRDRINEKMKALQELIPNSNKTDKASMLDEAIEYLKMLQLQLQMMSMRSGMSIPNMSIPSGMTHIQMGQMPPMSSMGMGMARMGMGPLGMIDMASNSAHPMMPIPHPGPSHSLPMTSAGAAMVDPHDHRLPGPNVMESLNAYLARQHHQQLQVPHPINMDVYSAYMMHHHHNQQQHQLHHLPNNLGGGGGAPQQP